MAAAEELLFERLCQVDPTLQDAVLKHRPRLDTEDYDRVEHVLKTEDSSVHHELRKAIVFVFDAKLFELGLEPGEDHHQLSARLFPVCTTHLPTKKCIIDC